MRRESRATFPPGRHLQPGSAVGAGEAALSSSPAQGDNVAPKGGLEHPWCWCSSRQPLLGMEGLLQPRVPTDAQTPLPAQTPVLGGGLGGGGRARRAPRREPPPPGLSWYKHDPEAGHCRRATPKQECQRGPSAPARVAWMGAQCLLSHRAPSQSSPSPRASSPRGAQSQELLPQCPRPPYLVPPDAVVRLELFAVLQPAQGGVGRPTRRTLEFHCFGSRDSMELLLHLLGIRPVWSNGLWRAEGGLSMAKPSSLPLLE